MYVRLPCRESREEILIEAIQSPSFGTLISVDGGTIHASHIPLAYIVRGGKTELVGHLARQNPQWRSLDSGTDVLATFVLDHAYISRSWYPSKKNEGRAAPTWNYIAVEARGPVELVDDPAGLLAIVDAMTRQQELGRPEPWSSSDAPRDYIDALLEEIVGLRLRPHTQTGAWKLDQTMTAADREGVARGGSPRLFSSLEFANARSTDTKPLSAVLRTAPSIKTASERCSEPRPSSIFGGDDNGRLMYA